MNGDRTLIEVSNLTKKYNNLTAVDGISFKVNEGEVFGFLGPNGAGKTTTIGMITTRVNITSGQAFIDGVDVRKKVALKRKIAVVPQSLTLDRSLTARENLIFHAKYFGVGRQEREKKADDLLKSFGLLNRQNDFVKRFSGGMAQRLMIARALMHNPKVLFLDEATTGLDPQSRRLLWEKIQGVNKSGQTIFLTTHYMEEANMLCDRVAIMDHGRILAIDTPTNLKKMIPDKKVIEAQLSQVKDSFMADVKQMHLKEIKLENNHLFLCSENGKGLIHELVNLASKHNIEIKGVTMHEPTLEDLFIHLTGRGIRE